VKIHDMDQRTPIIIGAKKEVKRVSEVLSENHRISNEKPRKALHPVA